jgi:gamma-glutamyltranspeptidase/glutathione hydrolase
MTDILAPAIHYAENGFPVTELIAYYMAVGASRYESFNFQNF